MQFIKFNPDGKGAVPYTEEKNVPEQVQPPKKQLLWDPEQLLQMKSPKAAEPKQIKEEAAAPSFESDERDTVKANIPQQTQKEESKSKIQPPKGVEQKVRRDHISSGETTGKRKRKVALIAAACAAVVVIQLIYLMPLFHYYRAEQMYTAGDYLAAADEYMLVGGYLDAKARVEDAKKAAGYEAAVKLETGGQFVEAISQYSALGNYRDSVERKVSCYMSKAEADLQVGHFSDAQKAYTNAQIMGNRDASSKLMELGMRCLAGEDYETAAAAFESSREENAEKYQKYALALQAWKRKDYALTDQYLEKLLWRLNDAPNFNELCRDLGYAILVRDKNDFADAKKYFEYLEKETSADKWMQEAAQEGLDSCKVAEALIHMENGDLRAARDVIQPAPESARWNSITAQDIQSKLSEYAKFVDICGKWRISAYNTIRCTPSRGGYYYSLKQKMTADEDQYVQVKCHLQEDGSVLLQGEFDQKTIYYSSMLLDAYFKDLRGKAESVVQKNGQTKIKDEYNGYYILKASGDHLNFQHKFTQETSELDSVYKMQHVLNYDCVLADSVW